MMMVMLLVVSLCGMCAMIVDASPVVEIPSVGTVVGLTDYANNSVFRGIPYAQPPVDALRWKSPRPLQKSFGKIDATEYGASCMQPDNTLGFNLSEDCLFLNIATPARLDRQEDLLPVMVWIHGGAYTTGSSSIPLYDPSPLVKASDNSIVVVTINYRLNVFGFLGGSEISNHNADDGASGNFGIADQRLALRWVRDNIKYFGGDAGNVTIFGESAGGNSVLNHLAQPASFDLYRRAIIESGVYNKGAFDFAAAERKYERVLAVSKTCTSLQCLLTMDASDLLNIGAQVTVEKGEDGWGPVVDGVSLTGAPTELIAKGRYKKTANILLGSNRDETAFWTSQSSITRNDIDERGFDESIKAWSNFTDDEIVDLKRIYRPGTTEYVYPSDLGEYSDWWWAFTRVGTDNVPGLGACSVRWISRTMLASGTPNVYAYLFAHPTQSSLTKIPSEGPGSTTVAHASEIAYVFGNRFVLDAGDEANLSIPISKYFTNFAIYGDPNGNESTDDLPRWPAFKDDEVLRMDIPSSGGIRVQRGLRKTACDWQDAHPRPT